MSGPFIFTCSKEFFNSTFFLQLYFPWVPLWIFDFTKLSCVLLILRDCLIVVKANPLSLVDSSSHIPAVSILLLPPASFSFLYFTSFFSFLILASVCLSTPSFSFLVYFTISFSKDQSFLQADLHLLYSNFPDVFLLILFPSLYPPSPSLPSPAYCLFDTVFITLLFFL